MAIAPTTSPPNSAIVHAGPRSRPSRRDVVKRVEMKIRPTIAQAMPSTRKKTNSHADTSWKPGVS
jgi:hypothetical protein